MSPAVWKVLLERMEENPGPYLIEAGILEDAGLLKGLTVTIPLVDAVEECVIGGEAAAQIAGGDEHVRLRRIGDGKEYLVPRQILVEAIRGGEGLDYLEKGVD